ncbi:MAG: DUF1822 family protein [Spirulinaceae cyanobacterium]
MLQLQTAMATPTNPLILAIPPAAIATAETLIESQVNAEAAWRAYYHHIALNTFTGWLGEQTQDAVAPWLREPERSPVWAQLDGAALRWGEVRLALFASETIGSATLDVPQEWVDLPDWAADYYLAVELHLEADPEESWLAVTGYATQEMLREQGHYDPAERFYRLSRAAWVTDLNRLLLSQRLFGRRHPEPAPLPTLALEQAQKCLAIAAAHETSRLSLPFAEWGALWSQPDWRSQLYQQQMAALRAAEADTVDGQPLTTLRQWFAELGTEIQAGVEGLVSQGWQSLEAIAEEFKSPEAVLAYRFEGSYSRDVSTPFPTAVSGVVELLASPTDKETQLSAMHLLGQIGRGNPGAISALARFQHSTSDPDLQRQAAVSLGKIDPSHPAAGVRRGKIVDLGVRVGQAPLILMLTLLPEGAKTNLQVRLNGVNDRAVLPENIQLIIMDDAGTVFREERSRTHDQALQISFRASSGDRFGIKVVLGEASLTEFFTV